MQPCREKEFGAVESRAVHYQVDQDQIDQVPDHSSELTCPKCGSGHLHRVERKGFLEKRIYSFFGYYPWRCHRCRQKFYLKKRRLRRHHHHSSRQDS